MPLDLADDVRRRVRRELDAAVEVEAVDRLDQPDRADLDEVVELLAAVRVTPRERAHERHVLLDQLLARLKVAFLVVAAQQDLVVDPRHHAPQGTFVSSTQGRRRGARRRRRPHGLQDPARPELVAVPLEVGQRFHRERTTGRPDRAAVDGERDREVALVVAAAEHRIERHFEVLELLVGGLEAGCQPADDEACDLVEVLLRRQDELDLVAQ